MFTNPVTAAVARIEAKLATLDAEAIARLEENSTLDMGDWLSLGDMASRALMEGKIDASTAQTLHVIHTDFRNGATLAQRIVFLQCAQELLSGRIAAAR